MIRHLITFDIGRYFSDEYERVFGVDLYKPMEVFLPFRIIKGDLLYFNDFFNEEECLREGFNKKLLEDVAGNEPFIAHQVNVKIIEDTIEVNFIIER